MLSAQANPNIFGLPGAAQSQFGETIKDEGLRWLKHQIELENATELATNKNEFQKAIVSATDTVANGNVSNWVSPRQQISGRFYRRNPDYASNATIKRDQVFQKLQKELAKQANNISSRTVRSRFLSDGRQRITSTMSTLSSLLRTKYADYGKGLVIGALDPTIKSIGGVPKTNEKLRSQRIGSALADLRRNQQIYGYSEKWRMDQENKLLSGIDEYDINLAIADSGVTSTKLFELESEIRKGSYKFLSATAQSRLVKSIHSKANALSRYEVNSAVREENRAHVRLERKKNAKMSVILDSIAKGRLLAAQGKSDEAEKIMPTINSILKLDENELPKDGKNNLIKRLNGDDVVYNTRMRDNFYDDIRQAVTSDDLELISDQISKAYYKNLIGGKAYGQLKQYLKEARNNTPQFQENQKFETRLLQALSPKSSGYARGETPDIGTTEAQILNFYREEVQKGVRPQAAFLSALTLNNNVNENNVRLELANLDRSLLNALFDKTDINKVTTDEINKLTIDQYNKAYSEFVRILDGTEIFPDSEKDDKVLFSARELGERQFTGDRKKRMSKRDRMTVRGLYRQERRLNFLKNFIESKQK